MPALPLVIPLPKLLAYSDEFLGNVGAAYKTLLSLHLPVPETIVIPPATLELMYNTSPSRGKILELLKKYNESATDKHKYEASAHLKQHVSSLPLNPEIIHTLNHWYHDYLQHEEVHIVASNYPQFSQQHVKGNVNIIESLLEVWAASAHECLATRSHAHPCLAPTPIVLVRQPHSSITGVLFTHHPDQLSKASVVCYLWSNQIPTASASPAETLELDIRSNTIVRRSANPSAQANQPIQINQNQLAALFHSATVLKHQGSLVASATFVFDHDQLLFTELPSTYVLPEKLSSPPRTATKVLLMTPSLPAIKRSSSVGDGIGMVSVHQFLPPTDSSSPLTLRPTKLTLQLQNQVVISLTELLSSSKGGMTLFQSYVSGFGSDSLTLAALNQEIDIMSAVKKKTSTPLGLLATGIRTPAQWQVLLRILHTKQQLPSPTTPLWMEIATPAVAANLRYFDLAQVSGLVIHVDSLFNLALGSTSPIASIGDVKSLTNAVLSQSLQEIKQALATISSTQPLPLWIQISTVETDLIAIAVSAACQAIVCPINQVAFTREAISKSEKNLWQHLRRT